MKKNIWLPLILVAVFWFIGIGGAYTAIVIEEARNASIISLEPNVLFYSDMAATHSINKIRLPEATPGSVTNFTFYVKNNSTVSQIISAVNMVIPSSNGTISITIDGQTQITLPANAIARVDGVLNLPGQGPEGPSDFTVLINSAPASTASTFPTLPPATSAPTGTAVPPRTATPTTAVPTTSAPPITAVLPTSILPTNTTPVVLNGQAIYNANCLSCHRSRPPTNNLTQTQLSTFISNHNTGRNLTQEQVAAIVIFLKP